MKKVYLLIAFIIVQSISMILLNYNAQVKKEQILSEASLLVRTQYDTITNSFTTLANTVFRGYINVDDILEPFEARDRDALYDELKYDYRFLSKIGFTQIHFHLVDNISFLRMHKPSRYGDDLTKIRYSVDYVNTYKKPISGLEIGRVVPGFRYVYPLVNAYNKHLGSVETSFGVYTFAKKMEQVYNVHTHFLISKIFLNKKVFEDSKNLYTQSIEHKDFMTLTRGNSKKQESEVKYLKEIYNNQLNYIISENIAQNKLFTIELKLEEENKHIHKTVTFIPLYNIQKQYLGYFVVYHNSNSLLKLEQNLNKSYAVAFILIVLLFGFIYKELTTKETLALKVGEQTAKLQEAAVRAEEYAAEIEDINESLEEKIKIEIEKNTEQERKLSSQSKQAALGDMIGNIAHQWRQPLSAISTAASGMQLNYEMGLMEKEDFIKFSGGIIKNANYLSQTIDDFRDFIKSEKVFEEFDVGKVVLKTLAIVNSSINNHKLHIITNVNNGIKINNYANELQQAIINIFNNAKDAIKSKNLKDDDRLIFIDVYSKNNLAYISIKDSAGGIPESIMDKIFEPYFTTKHQSQGTGLGLYMTHQIIVDSMHGGIDIENLNFSYENKQYSGAQFILSFKLDK